MPMPQIIIALTRTSTLQRITLTGTFHALRINRRRGRLRSKRTFVDKDAYAPRANKKLFDKNMPDFNLLNRK